MITRAYAVERRAGRIVIECACGTRSNPLSARAARAIAAVVGGAAARFTFGKCYAVRGQNINMRSEYVRLARMLRAAAWLLQRQIKRRVGRARGKVGSDSSTRSGRDAVGRSSRQGSPVLLRARPTGRSRRSR